MTRDADWIARFASRRIAIVGDVMLDEFVVGRIDRISPEAPVPVVRVASETCRLGGAANVAHNVRALGGVPRLVGLTGDDAAARTLAAALRAHGISSDDLVSDSARPTTRKVRVVSARHQQVARLDYEDDAEASGTTLATLASRATAAAAEADAIVISDYRKGVVTADVIAATVRSAQSNAPILVDPKVPVAERYRGATLITPNHHEAELMTGGPIRSAADARDAARAIHDRTGASVVITWGEHGLWLLDAKAHPRVEDHLPAAAREVADVTGAGDTVIATLALALAAGAPLAEAARLANRAAGLVVARFGPAVVTREELAAADPASS